MGEEEKNPVGRPPIHTDPKAVEKLVMDYFEWIEGESATKEVVIGNDDEGKPIKETKEYWVRKPEPPTVTGLALHLGFCDKSTLYDYKNKPEFSHSIKKGLSLVEKHHEKQIAYGDKCTGNIFALKNMGWKDNLDINASVKQNTTITGITFKDDPEADLSK